MWVSLPGLLLMTGVEVTVTVSMCWMLLVKVVLTVLVDTTVVGISLVVVVSASSVVVVGTTTVSVVWIVMACGVTVMLMVDSIT